MSLKKTGILWLSILYSITLHAQLEKVMVETYYISDTHDATDTTGSVLPGHSKTYRIYIDMSPGCKLTKIYGNAAHEFRIGSDSVFYNHTVEGQTFPVNFNSIRFGEGTVPLDTWLTLGQLSTTKPTGKTYYGVPKTEDRDGSIIGGSHNDGGSLPVAGGLLVNTDPGAGIPLTTKDGLDTMSAAPSGWNNYGILDVSGNDSTIFGSLKKGRLFSSNAMFLQNNGVEGVNRDSNQVLIAQLTTRGKLFFALNVEIVDSKGNIFDYVAKNGSDSSNAGVIQSFYLNYPVPCGCLDPNYLEYNSAYGCMDSSACKTIAILGCMDTSACNYDPTANINVQDICCYPGYCNNRDISLVCPTLLVREQSDLPSFLIAPNPVEDELNLNLSGITPGAHTYTISDAFGKLVAAGKLEAGNGLEHFQVNTAGLSGGIYFIRLFRSGKSSAKMFIKSH
ncbi:MAG: T9SS type A sorting domain-containing protein [Bacteroidia bacterium]